MSDMDEADEALPAWRRGMGMVVMIGAWLLFAAVGIITALTVCDAALDGIVVGRRGRVIRYVSDPGKFWWVIVLNVVCGLAALVYFARLTCRWLSPRGWEATIRECSRIRLGR